MPLKEVGKRIDARLIQQAFRFVVERAGSVIGAGKAALQPSATSQTGRQKQYGDGAHVNLTG